MYIFFLLFIFKTLYSLPKSSGEQDVSQWKATLHNDFDVIQSDVALFITLVRHS